MDILSLGKVGLYNIKDLSLHIKNKLFSDSYRTFKNNTVRIDLSEYLNQNLQCN